MLVPDAVFRDGRFGRGCVEIDPGGRIVGYPAVPPDGSTPIRMAERALMPGFVNRHSHAFQRFIRGAAESPVPGQTSSFWSWRQAMYALVERLDPDSFHLAARATFREMLRAGYTRVHEFHYVHHGPHGQPYDDPNEMAWRLVAAAQEAGIALEIERAVYLNVLEPAQRRFSDGTMDAALDRIEMLRRRAPCPVGIAPHSIRAVSPEGFQAAAAWAEHHDTELHAHVAEQPREVAECVARYGRRPLALLSDLGIVSPRFVGVHLTHLDADEVLAVGRAGATACICPSTEANLGDGIPDLKGLLEGGARLAIGSDSQAHLDPFAELRMLEYNERLRRGERCVFEPGTLLAHATGRAAPGDRAEFVVIDLNAPSIVTAGVDALAGAIVLCGGPELMDGLWLGTEHTHPEPRLDWLRAARERCL